MASIGIDRLLVVQGLAIVQVVLMQKAVDHGLGRHFNTLEATERHKASKVSS